MLTGKGAESEKPHTKQKIEKENTIQLEISLQRCLILPEVTK